MTAQKVLGFQRRLTAAKLIAEITEINLVIPIPV